MGRDTCRLRKKIKVADLFILLYRKKKIADLTANYITLTYGI